MTDNEWIRGDHSELRAAMAEKMTGRHEWACELSGRCPHDGQILKRARATIEIQIPHTGPRGESALVFKLAYQIPGKRKLVYRLACIEVADQERPMSIGE